MVAVEGRIVDKPADEHEAAGAIGALAGRGHEVWGAVVIAGPGGQWREGLDRSEVRFRSLSPQEVREYVGTGEWRGRAGG
ncbi:MAG: Maf family protein, partial [Solirubrobacterales bacterium]